MTGNEYQKEALRTASGMNYEHHGILSEELLSRGFPYSKMSCAVMDDFSFMNALIVK